MDAASKGSGALRRLMRRIWRLLLQTIFIVVLAPALLLALVELGLRVAGVGHSMQVFVKGSFQGQPFYATNKYFYRQFFLSRVDMAPCHNEVAIPATKPEGTYRIFVLGSSAAHGTPPDAAFNFSRVLDTMLRARYPSARIEVWEVAYVAINSSVIRVIAKACAKLEPDLFVVYMGNNEVNGPFAAAVVPGTKCLPWPLPVIRGTMFLRELRMTQVFTGLARSQLPAPRLSMGPIQTADDPRLLAAYERYRTNSADICRFARRAGAQTILCTVGCNLRDWSPGQSVHQKDLSEADRQRWEALYQEGNAFTDAGNATDAVRTYEAAAVIDDTYAELHFRLGACYWQLNDYERAKHHFIEARRQDRFWNRIAPALNDIVGEVARAHADQGVHFADAAGALAEASPHGVPGREVFYDNVHMTFQGNCVIGSLVFDEVNALLPESIRCQAVDSPRLTRAECEARLGLTPAVLLGHYQQVLGLNTDALHQKMNYLEQARTELEQQCVGGTLRPAAEGYGRALQLHGPDWLLRFRYTRTLYELGDFSLALPQADLLASEFPFRRETHSLRGMLLAKAERTEEAASEFRTALDLYPDDRTSCDEWGSLLEQAQDFQAARTLYRSFLRNNPDDRLTMCREARVLAKLGEGTTARQMCRSLFDADPKFLDAYTTLDEVLRTQSDPAIRIVQWQAIAAQHPDIDRPFKYLANALQDGGDLDGAIRAYNQAVERNPGDASTCIELASTYLAKGDAQAAVGAARNALRANPDGYLAHRLLLKAFLRLGDHAAARAELDQCRRLGQSVDDALVAELDRQAGASTP